MSEPARPSADLLSARRQLERKGYLRGGLPPSPPGPWRRAVDGALWWAAATATLVGGVLAGSGASWSDVAALALAVAPVVGLAILAAAGAGRRLAAWWVGWGGSPQGVAAALGGVAVLAAALGLGAGVWFGEIASDHVRLLAGLNGIICAGIAGLAARRGLQRALGVTAASVSSVRTRSCEVIALLAVSAAGTGLAMAPPVRPSLFPTPAGFAAPPASGRVAVVGVDGLGRGDLEALATLFPGEGWEQVAGWGWVEVEGVAAPLAAVTWTSIACGAPPRQHGVSVLEEVQLFGRSSGVGLPALLRGPVVALWSPLSLARVVARPALDRRLPTLWEMASRAGCPVLVGGWWGSWPVRQVLGEVVSERAWLGGATGVDAVTPALAEVVQAAWERGRQAPAATDLLAAELVRRAVAAQGPALVVLWLPGLDLSARLPGDTGPLAVAARLHPHLQVLRGLLERLAEAGYTLWLVARPLGSGAPFAASASVSDRGRRRASSADLVATWLNQLGLPPPVGGTPLSCNQGGEGETLKTADYGPPPPPVERPSVASATVQREVLRNLGYLR